MIYDFYDRLKSSTKGYGTMDYDVIGFRPGELVKVDVLVNGDRVDALSGIVNGIDYRSGLLVPVTGSVSLTSVRSADAAEA